MKTPNLNTFFETAGGDYKTIKASFKNNVLLMGLVQKNLDSIDNKAKNLVRLLNVQEYEASRQLAVEMRDAASKFQLRYLSEALDALISDLETDNTASVSDSINNINTILTETYAAFRAL